MEFDIESIVNDLDFSKDCLNDCGHHMFLTNYELEILAKYHIDYHRCSSLKELIFLIEEILNEESDLEDLESISKSISERDYYLNTNH